MTKVSEEEYMHELFKDGKIVGKQQALSIALKEIDKMEFLLGFEKKEVASRLEKALNHSPATQEGKVMCSNSAPLGTPKRKAKETTK